MNSEKVAGFIAELRKSKNMTQKELAEQLHITDKAVSKWERGQSYPDITMLPELCGLLGVSINELLSGGYAGGEAETALDADEIVENTLDYAQKASKQNKLSGKAVAVLALAITFLIAVFVCTLCDFVITGGIGWSLYPIGSVVLAWCVTAPLIWFKRYRLVISLSALTALILPFLALVEYAAVPVKSWLLPIGLPAALAALAYLWVIVALITFTRLNRWFVGAVAVFLTPVLDFMVSENVEQVLAAGEPDSSTILTLLCAAIIGLILCMIGVIRKRKHA